MKVQTLNFTVGYSDSADAIPKEMYPATVPGAVQLDYAKAIGLDNIYFADNLKKLHFLEDKWWHYTATLPSFSEGKTYLCCDGIDYSYRVRIDDTVIYEHEGLYKPFRLDISEYGGKSLYIDIAPVPKIEGIPESRSQAAACCKPPVSYGWDWHPRLIPIGIWENIWVENTCNGYIEKFHISYNLNDTRTKTYLKMKLRQPLNEEYTITVTDPDGKLIKKYCGCGSAEIRDTIEDIKLWWPNGYGNASLYSITATINADKAITKTRKIGFKTVELLMPEDSWKYPQTMPKSRSDAPTLMTVNGKGIFLKGSNWVAPEIFYGTLNRERYLPLVKFAKEAHFNILRVWGGGVVHKPEFYDLCDEMGILIWQEFPLACNEYKNDPHYLSVLEDEASQIIKKLRHHASLALWCGGNELFNSWSRMTEQHHALRLLNAICYKETPEIPFIMTSPLCNMAHGSYTFNDIMGGKEREVYEIINTAENTAYPEFGCPAFSPIETIHACIPENEIFPPKPTESWVLHHGFDAWQENSWTELPTIEKYFGKAKNIEELIANSNILQCEGLKAIFEGARRQWPRCTMALNWYYDEAWPTAAGEYLISYFGKARPAYYATKDSLRPTFAGAQNYRFSYKEGDVFEAKLWLLNDSFKSIDGATVTAYLELDGKRLGEISWATGKGEPQQNIEGPTLRVLLPHAENGIMKLKVCCNLDDSDSEYSFIYTKDEKADEPKPTEQRLNQ